MVAPGLTKFAAIGVVALAMAGTANARFQDDYGRGKEAVESGDWASVVEAMRAAIEQNPDSAERIRIYGMRFDSYLPHYFLGRGLYEQGDCAGALDALDRAKVQGVINSMPEFADLQRIEGACQAQVVDVTAIASAARNGIQALDDAVKDFERIRSEPLLEAAWSNETSWQGALSDGMSAVTRLTSALTAATDAKDADAIEAITREASSLRDQVLSASGSAGQRLTQLRAAEEQRAAEARNQAVARRELLAAVASARGLVDETAPDAASRTAQQELLNLVQRSDQLGDSASSSALNQLNRNIGSKMREYRAAVQAFQVTQSAIARRTPPAGLKRIAEAYFSGRYDEAAQISDPSAFGDEREKIQAHLFRAAARFNQYTLAGADSARLLQQAEQDIKAIKRLDQAFQPFVNAFPPKFSEFFARTM